MESKEFRARITSKNQLTLPAGVSALLNVGPGDDLRFEVTAEGIQVTPVPVRERLAPLIGSRRVGAGKSRQEIDAEVRDLRGPRDE
jgi:AbrB family looped-hinge helix DNA binding protein